MKGDNFNVSSIFRNEIFVWLIGSVQLSDNILFNWVLALILGLVLSVITFKMVGGLYHSNSISGSFLLYFIHN